MDLGLAGKLALVTGGGREIGRAEALALAAERVSVAVNALHAETCNQTVALVRAAGGRAEAYPAEVSDEWTVVQMMDAIVQRFGGLYIFVNNAGLQALSAGTHVHGLDREPKRFDADRRRSISRTKAAQSAATVIGRVIFTDVAPRRSSIWITVGAGVDRLGASDTVTNCGMLVAALADTSAGLASGTTAGDLAFARELAPAMHDVRVQPVRHRHLRHRRRCRRTLLQHHRLELRAVPPAQGDSLFRHRVHPFP